MIQVAWLWIRHQPQSALTRWFKERSQQGRKRAIVALARKLLVALWKYVTQGVVIEGAVMKPAAWPLPGASALAPSAGKPPRRERWPPTDERWRPQPRSLGGVRGARVTLGNGEDIPVRAARLVLIIAIVLLTAASVASGRP